MTVIQKREALGLFAGALTTGSFIPQVVKLWRMAPKAAPDVSVLMYVIIVIGVALWIGYGIWIKSLAATMSNIVTLVLTASILLYKLLYG
jgi:MtN3 and saliva related transmembrane protein